MFTIFLEVMQLTKLNLIKSDKNVYSFNVEAFRYAVSRCDSSEKFAEVMTTLMKSIEDHVKEIRTQLVLCVLLHEGLILYVNKTLCVVYNNITLYK